jgi:hypothetical protein
MIEDALDSEGLPSDTLGHLVVDDVELAKTANRSVRGCMNEPSGGERRVQRGRGSADASGLDAGFLGLFDLGHEFGEGALCRALVAGVALLAVLHAPGRVATHVDAQLVDVWRPHEPQASRHSVSLQIVGGMLGSAR